LIFALAFIFLIAGVFLCGIVGLMPIQIQMVIPDMFRVVFFFLGGIISAIGLIILRGRAEKTGSIHLLEFGRPGTVNWFYFYKDDTMKITPAIRDVEAQLYSKELDAQITELKSYRLFDHSIRIVPEGVGHAVDLDMVLYSNLFRSKWGFQSIRSARRNIFSSMINMFRQPELSELPKEKMLVSKGEEDGENK